MNVYPSKKRFFILIFNLMISIGLITNLIFVNGLEGLEWKVSTGDSFEFITQDRYLGEQSLLYEEISFATHTINGYIFDDVYALVYETPYESKNFEEIGKVRVNSQNRSQPRFNLEKIIPSNITDSMMKNRLDQTFSIMYPFGQMSSQINGWNYTAIVVFQNSNISINVIYNIKGIMALWQVLNDTIIEIKTYLKGSPFEPTVFIPGFDPIIFLVVIITVSGIQAVFLIRKKWIRKGC